METPAWLDSLSEKDRQALRLIWHRRMSVGEVATEMGVGFEATRSRLARIRAKAGGRATDVIARALADSEAMHLYGVHPGSGPDLSTRFPQPAPAVREERAVFEAAPPPAPIERSAEDWRRNGLSISQRLLLMLVAAILVATLLSQSVPISQSFQQLANLVEPPRR